MKRGILPLTLLLLLIGPIVLAEEANVSQAEEQLSALRGGLDEKTENILEREIQIPPQLQFPMQLIFGLKKNIPVTIERFIVLLAIWTMFFTIIQGTLKITPILNKGILNIAGSIIVTILIALTGTMDKLAIFFFELGDTFKWLEALGPFQLLIALVIAALVMAIGHYIMHIIETKYILTKAEYAGENIGTMAKMAKVTSKNIKKLSK